MIDAFHAMRGTFTLDSLVLHDVIKRVVHKTAAATLVTFAA
jgi:hypothetical protein